MKKKSINGIGLISLILILVAGLFGVVPALAADVEPLADASMGVGPPDNALNDGTGVLEFYWDCTAWEDPITATWYSFSVHEYDPVTLAVGPAMFIQYSDGYASDNFTPGSVSHTLQNVVGTVGTAHIRQPGYPSATHDWDVPDGFTAGYYQAQVTVRLSEGAPVAASIPFQIVEAMGCLTVEKVSDTGAPQQGWVFDIYGPDDPVSWNATLTTGPDGTATLCDLLIGEYRAVETMQPDWTSVDPGGSDPYFKDATVPTGDTVTITFINSPAPGCIWIHKYYDEVPYGSYQGDSITEPGLADWDFVVYGPNSLVAMAGSGMTDTSGNLSICDLEPGTYRIVEIMEIGWFSTDPGGTPPVYKDVVVTSSATTPVIFGNQELAELRVEKFYDENSNGVWDPEDYELYDWIVVIDYEGMEIYRGLMPVTLPDAMWGDYEIRELMPGGGWDNTTANPVHVTLNPGDDETVQFGNHYDEPQVPTLGQWGIITLSAGFVGMLLWFGARKRLSTR